MDQNSVPTRLCPYCKEEINVEAIKCKHCKSYIQPEKPGHGGICPDCKEEINPEAIKCKHCGSFVGPDPNVFLSSRSGLIEPSIRSRARNRPTNFRQPTRLARGELASPLDFEFCEEDCVETRVELGSYTIIFEDAYCCNSEEVIGDDGKTTVQYYCSWVPCRPPEIVYHPDRPISPPRPLDPQARHPVPTFITS
jgi:hypothetical protein